MKFKNQIWVIVGKKGKLIYNNSGKLIKGSSNLNQIYQNSSKLKKDYYHQYAYYVVYNSIP